jgi:hypothetical protein
MIKRSKIALIALVHFRNHPGTIEVDAAQADRDTAKMMLMDEGWSAEDKQVAR